MQDPKKTETVCPRECKCHKAPLTCLFLVAAGLVAFSIWIATAETQMFTDITKDWPDDSASSQVALGATGPNLCTWKATIGADDGCGADSLCIYADPDPPPKNSDVCIPCFYLGGNSAVCKSAGNQNGYDCCSSFTHWGGQEKNADCLKIKQNFASQNPGACPSG